MKKALMIQISGAVQGVSFRYYSSRKARELDLAGWIRNESDGSITILVEGEQQAVDKFVAWCRHGPLGASVSRVEVKKVSVSGFKEFLVKRQFS